MPSKLEQLRQGLAVEIEPGLSGRLNKEKKSLELSSGETLDVSKNHHYFPANEQQQGVSKQREYLERNAKGPIGEFLHQYTSQGIPGGISDMAAYLTQTGQDYTNRKIAEAEVSERISQESPWTSAAATGANIATDIGLTRGMSAMKAAPLLTAGSAGSKLITEPGQVTQDAIMAAGGGWLVDKTVGGLGKITARRGQSRAIPEQQRLVAEANSAQKEQFNALKQNVKNVNEAKLKQYQDDLNVRQNKIIQDRNAYEQRKLQRDAEVIRLKNKADMEKAQRASSAANSEAEYRTAKQAAEQENKRMTEQFNREQEQYKIDLQKLPEMQKQAQQEYSKGVVENAEKISKAFPEGSRLYSSQLGAGQFIDESIQKGSMAGTKYAAQSSRILKSLFPEGEILSSKELASRYKSLEGAIQNASPEVRQILNEFKTHMGEKLPSILADNMAYNRIVPALKTTVQKEVSSVLDGLGLAESGVITRSLLKNRAESNVKQIFNELTPQEFMQKMQSGEIREMITKRVISPEDFSQAILAKKSTPIIPPEDYERLGIRFPDPSGGKYSQFKAMFEEKLDKALAKAELKLIAIDADVATKLGAKVRKTYGMAEPVPSPLAPSAPSPVSMPEMPVPAAPLASTPLPGPITPPGIPPMPGKPALMPEPSAPSAIPSPNLAPAQGIAEMAGDVLEKPILGGGRGMINNPLIKLGGLKYLLGNAALPAEAAYLGMKGLTSPTAGGAVARASFKQAGIQAIEAWAQRYPSYRNGILENPQERRSLTKEIENDPEIPLEQKAVIQSKINRGKPLQDRL